MNTTVLLALVVGVGIVIGLAVAPIACRRAGLLLLAASLLALVLCRRSRSVGPRSRRRVRGGRVHDPAGSVGTPRHVDRPRRGCPRRRCVVESRRSPGVRVRLRQPRVPDIAIEPPEATDVLDASVVARRRGRHHLPPVATRSDGPLRLASWYRGRSDATELLVYPDLPAARRLAVAVRQGRFRDPGRLTRGPLGLGTDFESIRDYLAR